MLQVHDAEVLWRTSVAAAAMSLEALRGTLWSAGMPRGEIADVEACAQKRGEISLRNPTVRNLMLFTEATSAVDALARLRGRTVTTIAPRVIVGPDGARRILMPGDPDY